MSRVILLLSLLTLGCATAPPRRVQLITDPVTGRVYTCVDHDPCDAPPGLRPPQ